MGVWGTAISSNDTYADIYGIFFELYNEGLAVKDISRKLIADNQEIIHDRYESNNFWFALSKAQWECKQLDNELLERVKQIINTDADLEIWRQLDADEKEIKKRSVFLSKFLADLQTENPKAKARKKKIILQPAFEKGDCLTFKLANGNYGGAVVLEANKATQCGWNLIATTRINQPIKPTKKDFENTEVLVNRYVNWGNDPNVHLDNDPNVRWYFPVRFKQVAHLFERVDSIDVQIDYESENSMFAFCSDFEILIIQEANQQFKSEETKPRSTTRQTVKELTKKNKWKFW